MRINVGNCPSCDASGVFYIHCTATNKYLVRQSMTIGRAIGSHISGLLTGSHPCTEMQNDFNKYGIQSFEFNTLEIYATNAFVTDNECEAYWMAQYAEKSYPAWEKHFIQTAH